MIRKKGKKGKKGKERERINDRECVASKHQRKNHPSDRPGTGGDSRMTWNLQISRGKEEE
jgi:hypothetical protein